MELDIGFHVGYAELNDWLAVYTVAVEEPGDQEIVLLVNENRVLAVFLVVVRGVLPWKDYS